MGGTKPGRRVLTEINHAYVTRLAAHFQGDIRALHSEASAAIAEGIADANLRIVVQTQFTRGRLLDKGNANAANIGADFGHFGSEVWDKVTADRVPNAHRTRKLDELLEWRNGIAHEYLARRHARSGAHDDGRLSDLEEGLGQPGPSFDRVVADQVENLGRPRPW